MNDLDRDRSPRAAEYAAPAAGDNRVPGQQIGSGALSGGGALDYSGAPSVFSSFLPSDDASSDAGELGLSGLDLSEAFASIDSGSESAADATSIPY